MRCNGTFNHQIRRTAFFRADRGNEPNRLYINTGYWCEKLQAVDCNGYGDGKAREFSFELFEQRVKERFEEYFESRRISDERRERLWRAIEREVLERAHDGAARAFDALHDFHDDEFPRLFEDCWEWNCKEYTFHFMWNLYAIAWAIRKYDAAKAAVPDEVTP